MSYVKLGNPEYQNIHNWLRVSYGYADRCENKNCEGKSNNFNWAKKHGHSYKKDRRSFFRLCKSCHTKYDFTIKTYKLMKLDRPRITEEKKELIIKAYQNGEPLDLIAKKYDVAIATVYRIIKQK